MVTERADSAIRTEPMAIHVNPYELASEFESRWGYQFLPYYIRDFRIIVCAALLRFGLSIAHQASGSPRA